MTENEAIKDIQFLARRYDDLQEVNMSVSQESLDIAIQALEEIQQYQAIGTVEECKSAVERMKPKKPKIQSRGVYDEDNGDWMRDEIWHMCPTCRIRNEVYPTWKLCHYCGQALDWSE